MPIVMKPLFLAFLLVLGATACAAQERAQARCAVMPSFKENAAEFSDSDVSDMVEYLIKLREGRADTAAAARGQENFAWCVDCHGKDARGITGIGAPDLLAPQLRHGQTREALFESIAKGRTGNCPADIVPQLQRKP
jgi:cytochrome c oxidase cbb3-type subunit 3